MFKENQGHKLWYFRLKIIHYLLFFNWDCHTAGKVEIHMHGERKDIESKKYLWQHEFMYSFLKWDLSKMLEVHKSCASSLHRAEFNLEWIRVFYLFCLFFTVSFAYFLTLCFLDSILDSNAPPVSQIPRAVFVGKLIYCFNLNQHIAFMAYSNVNKYTTNF